ncbi:hypothetical protein EVAR_55242_1 [Eumeta japonica]|uniref:Uncharacterized protein n=1 Tax=Eumeta variegata TaxID=151549 RepID=A0A4C1Y4P7_EUMVA|nr:hypothetical protein EVAR_55242_1 [Eumeta japonica]
MRKIVIKNGRRSCNRQNKLVTQSGAGNRYCLRSGATETVFAQLTPFTRAALRNRVFACAAAGAFGDNNYTMSQSTVWLFQNKPVFTRKKQARSEVQIKRASMPNGMLLSEQQATEPQPPWATASQRLRICARGAQNKELSE